MHTCKALSYSEMIPIEKDILLLILYGSQGKWLPSIHGDLPNSEVAPR